MISITHEVDPSVLLTVIWAFLLEELLFCEILTVMSELPVPEDLLVLTHDWFVVMFQDVFDLIETVTDDLLAPAEMLEGLTDMDCETPF